MSKFADLQAIHRDNEYDMYADDAQWSGVTGTVRVIVTRSDEVMEIGNSRSVSSSVVMKVRVSDVAAPDEGDTVAIGSENYRIVSDPHKGRAGDEWLCEAMKVVV